MRTAFDVTVMPLAALMLTMLTGASAREPGKFVRSEVGFRDAQQFALRNAAIEGIGAVTHGGDGLAAAAEGLVAAAQGQHKEYEQLREEMRRELSKKGELEETMKKIETMREQGEEKLFGEAMHAAEKMFHKMKYDDKELEKAKNITDYEQKARKQTELEILKAKEESLRRGDAAKQQGEQALLEKKLISEERQKRLELDEKLKEKTLDGEIAKTVATEKASGDIRAERENEDVRTRQRKMEEEQKRATTLASIREVMSTLASWSFNFNRLHLYFTLFSITCIFAGFFFSRELAVLARFQLNKWLGLPSLVRVTSRQSLTDDFYHKMRSLIPFVFRYRPLEATPLTNIVLPDDISRSIQRLANVTSSRKQHKMPLRNVMFYGPPGTGKTMMAKRFAEYSGLEYAIMSGGDVAPLGEHAVTELHNLFKWVSSSERGVVLFIDEADAFLCTRNASTMSENVRNALNTVLYHTGTPSNQFMLIIATNRPHDLDPAILDRLDEKVEFGLPKLPERIRLVKMYFDEYVAQHLMAAKLLKDVDDDALEKLAFRLDGFSGREIAKLMGALQVHATDEQGLSSSTFYEITEKKISEHRRFQEPASPLPRVSFEAKRGYGTCA